MRSLKQRRSRDKFRDFYLYLGLALVALCVGLALWLSPGCGFLTTKSGNTALWCSSNMR
jgi:hypothetical protein